MILRNIRVQGFGCFAGEIEVGPFTDGINLLYAPNGTGKSTLVKAFTAALVDGHRVKCAELQDWKPWGRGLSPRIVVEFEHGQRAYRLEKRFLQGAASGLLRKEGAAWTQFMQNEDADDFVRNDILNCTPPGNGLAKPKHWGLAQILWTTQGDLAMPELAGNVVDSIQQSVGAALTAAGSKIESKVAGLYAEFYPPKRATLKVTAPLNAMQREYGRLLAERAVAEQELAEFDRKSAGIDGLRAQLSEARVSRSALEEQRKTAAERLEQYRGLQAQRSQQAERKAARQAIYLNLKRETDAIRDTRKKIEETQTAVRDAEARVPGRQADVDARTRACYQIQLEVGSASKERQQANAELLIAQLSREYVQTVTQFESVTAAIADTGQIESQIAELAAKKASLRAPTAPEVAKARKLAAEERQCELRLETARVTAEIEPASSGSVRVIEGETVGEIALRAGTAASIPGSPNVAFEIPGFGSIRVRGPVTDYVSIRGQLEKCRAALCGFEERFRTRDIERLESMRAEYAGLEQQVLQLEERRTGILGQNDSNRVHAQRDRLSRRIAEIEEAHTEWRVARPDPQLLEGTARQAFARAEAKVRDAEARCQEANTQLIAAEKSLSTAQAGLIASREKSENLKSELRRLTGDGKTGAERNAALDEALLEYDAARAAVERIDGEMREFGGGPSPQLALIEKELKQADERLKRVETGIVQAETEITLSAAKSPYERFVKLDEAAAMAAGVVEREGRRMEAIKLLNDVVVQTKASLLKTVAGPVEKAANENLAAICARPFGEIRMSSTFGTASVRPAALEPENDGVAIAQLSGGEKEQLHLCTRLALASELAKQERQLLVLDDVLSFTDNDHLKRICDLLASAAGRLQILILTCHPERFITIENAKPFDLEALVRSSAGEGK